MKTPPLTIISGGQTGADRAALDWAIANGIPHGGWCPKGRKAEDGVIPARYQLREPILTFPGWLVTLKGKSDVHVLNPKQIRQVVLIQGVPQNYSPLGKGHQPSTKAHQPFLSPAQIQRIVHQLDQKCRDVEL